MARWRVGVPVKRWESRVTSAAQNSLGAGRPQGKRWRWPAKFRSLTAGEGFTRLD